MDTFYQLDVRMDKDEYRNFITIFIDEYNLFLKTDDYYNQFHKTYISLFNADIYDILHTRENSEIVLSFRIPGATRGGIVLTKGILRIPMIQQQFIARLNLLNLLNPLVSQRLKHMIDKLLKNQMISSEIRNSL